MRKIFLTVALIVIVALIGLNVFLGKIRQTSPQTLPQTPQRETAIPPVDASQTDSVSSPDGKLSLTMKTTKNKDGITHSFTVSGKEIFVKTTDRSTSFLLPPNTFSPDNKYVFLKEVNSAGMNFFALSATTQSSEQNDQTANITDLFTKKYPDLAIHDVTGWGGINLIIVNSAKKDGSRGPSFWFGMPNHSLTQLSTLF